MRDSQVCAHCGATTTQLRLYPALMAWFCAGPDAALCDARKRAQP